MNYAYDDAYSVTNICYVSSVTPAPGTNSGACAAAISGSASYLLGNAFYNAPANFGSFAVAYAPTKQLKTNFGYHINRVAGSAEELNLNMVPGALQSRYQTPYADVELKIAPQWVWHGDWQYTGYGEDGQPGPTAARNVHGNVLTLGVKYAF
jgi:hypothetical protein